MELPRTPGRTTPAFGFSYIERALVDCFVERKFGRNEKEQVIEFFGRWERQPACVFCGTPEVRRWDHLIPVMDGGATVLGNMVPACAPCDDSKSRQPYKEWMTSNSSKSPIRRGVINVKERIQRIHDYVTHFGYICGPVESQLTADEIRRRTQLLGHLQELRREVDSLVDDYRRRKGDNWP